MPPSDFIVGRKVLIKNADIHTGTIITVTPSTVTFEWDLECDKNYNNLSVNMRDACEQLELVDKPMASPLFSLEEIMSCDPKLSTDHSQTPSEEI